MSYNERYIKRDSSHRRNLVVTDEGWKFIRDNWSAMNNQQLADAFGVHLDRMRIILHAKKMFRIELEYWTEEQTQFLIDNYKIFGDKELEILFTLIWPDKKKGWSFKHIEKKRKYLKLKRTPDEILAVKKYYYSPGGRCDVIRQFSASVHLKDGYVAQALVGTRGNKNAAMEREILEKHPELIIAKRAQLLHMRELKKQQYERA